MTGGQQTCMCIGNFREFVKATGACECRKGYKPKNNAPDEDSIEDCEEIEKVNSADCLKTDEAGNCVTEEQQKEICDVQCAGRGGGVFLNQGQCKCNTIVDTSAVCPGGVCTEFTESFKNGTFVWTDPVTGKKVTKDPTEVEGFIQSSTCDQEDDGEVCNVHVVGLDEDGNFVFSVGGDGLN